MMQDDDDVLGYDVKASRLKPIDKFIGMQLRKERKQMFRKIWGFRISNFRSMSRRKVGFRSRLCILLPSCMAWK